MRICLISKEYPPATGWGGIGAYNFQIAQGLKETGHDVEVVSLMSRDDPDNRTGGKEPDGAVIEQGIPVHRALWRTTLSELSMLYKTMPYSHYNLETNLALWRKFAEINQKAPFDVAEAPEHLADGLMVALTKSVPLVIKLHTPQSKLIAERFHNLAPSFDQQFVAMTERLAMLGADKLVSPSQNLADWVSADLAYPRDDIAIVRNPVDANRFCPEGDGAVPSDGRLTVLFAGRLEARKGVHTLVQAIPLIVSKHKSVRFVFVGADTNTAKGQTSVLAELRKMLAASGCSDYVTFISSVKLDEMPAYYRSGDICVAPSLYDNAPYTCIEAMSCGRAFIGSTAGGMAEYMVPGESGLIVEPADAPALANAILQLLADESLRARLGTNARERVLKEFHRTALAKQMIEHYEIARDRFKVKSQNAIYRKGDMQFVADAQQFLRKYDTALYEMLYVNSWAFRLRHWGKRFKSQPDQLMHGLLQRLLPGQDSTAPPATTPGEIKVAEQKDVECKV